MRATSVSAEIALLRGAIKGLTTQDLYRDYGIIVNEDKTVYDETYEKSFSDISKWIQFYASMLAQEAADEEYEDSFKGQSDDDY